MEALLSKEPCIGSLNRWARYYAYNEDMPSRTLYRGIIDFHFEEAGTPGVTAGSNITHPNAWVRNDDRPIKMAWGDYDVSKRRLTIGFCGENVGPSTDPYAIRDTEYHEALQRRQAQQQQRERTR